MLPAGPASSAARVVWDVSEQGQALLAVLFPHLAGLDLERVEDLGETVRITARTRTAALACRGCWVVSSQVQVAVRVSVTSSSVASVKSTRSFTSCARSSMTTSSVRQIRWSTCQRSRQN